MDMTDRIARHPVPGVLAGPGQAVRSLAAAGLLLTSLLLAGCASQQTRPIPPLTGDPMVDGQQAIQHGPERDRVLWEYRTSLAALRRQHFDTARPLLDSALARVEGVYGYDPTARQSRRYFEKEAKKTFIGEPYERVMGYYYRGLLYWKDGEPDNARACFRSGQVHDSDTENKEYASDYVLLDYLDGLATAKLNGDGSDAFRRAQENARSLALPPLNPKANVLFFVDYGPGPVKYATGPYGEQLRFRAPNSPIRSAQLRLGDRTVPLPPYDNLLYQATTRGGRVMDHILGRQAVFKSSTDAAGNAALISGAILATDRQTAEVGLGLLAAGLVSKIVSAATAPEADTRSWDNLPLCLSFAALELPPGDYTATVEFLDESHRLIGNLTKHVTLQVTTSAEDLVVYVSDRSVPLTSP